MASRERDRRKRRFCVSVRSQEEEEALRGWPASEPASAASQCTFSSRSLL